MTTKIGIVAQGHDDKFGVNTNYLSWIYNFGFPIILLPASLEEFHDLYKLDALVIPGGADVDYKRYSKIPSLYNYQPNIFLEHFDTQILPSLIGKIPIFGICRGLQTLNVHFGGTLKNLWDHPYSKYDSDETHEISASNGSNNSKIKMKVNSFHHQAISTLGAGLKTEAKANDGVIEAISFREKGIAAVQWHPERLLDEYSIALFSSILYL